MSKDGFIQITLNGEDQKMKSGTTVADLLVCRSIRPERATVELNGEILQKLDYDLTQIKDKDRIEIVLHIGGSVELIGVISSPPFGGREIFL